MPESLPDDVATYLASVPNDRRRADAQAVTDMMRRVTGESPKMWGTSIIGFGHHHYRYDSGREGDTVVIGLSARQQALTLYGLVYYDDKPLPDDLGPTTRGKGCLYIKDLRAIDQDVLARMIADSWSTNPRD